MGKCSEWNIQISGIDDIMRTAHSASASNSDTQEIDKKTQKWLRTHLKAMKGGWRLLLQASRVFVLEKASRHNYNLSVGCTFSLQSTGTFFRAQAGRFRNFCGLRLVSGQWHFIIILVFPLAQHLQPHSRKSNTKQHAQMFLE